MALQTSGPISFANLQTEFGGTHPITMGEYAEFRVSGSGDTISMDQFYGAFAGVNYVITQAIWSSGVLRGYDKGRQMGSIVPDPATYEGASINVIQMAAADLNFLSIHMSPKVGQDLFTTFTGGGFTLLSAEAGFNLTATANGVSWTWAVDSAGGFTGSGDLDINLK